MDTTIASASAESDVVAYARALEDATQNLCRATLARPQLNPADVDIVLGHLAEAAAALPQAAAQLSDILDETRHRHALEMDSMAETCDPDLAIDTARFRLEDLRTPAVELYRHLNAARRETARIAVVGANRNDDAPTQRHDRRPEPPSAGRPASGPGYPAMTARGIVHNVAPAASSPQGQAPLEQSGPVRLHSKASTSTNERERRAAPSGSNNDDRPSPWRSPTGRER